MLRRLAFWIGLCGLSFAGSAALVGCTHAGGAQTAALQTRLPTSFGFFFLDEGASAKLAYGQANSDNVALMLQCAKGSRMVEVSYLVSAGSAPTLILTSAGRRDALKAQVRSGEEQPMVVAQTPAAAPTMAAFRKSGRMELAYSGRSYGVAARPAELASIERFFSACERRA